MGAVEAIGASSTATLGCVVLKAADELRGEATIAKTAQARVGNNIVDSSI